MIQLKILKGPQKVGEEFEIKNGESVIIGRSTNCKIKLLSSGISKQHCKLTSLSGGRIEVEDLGSSNGTYVNGVQVQKQTMRPGDSLSLNEFLFQIIWKPDATLPAHYLSQSRPIGSPQSQINAIDGSSNVKVLQKNDNSLLKIFASWIDPLTESIPVHFALFSGFLIWTFLTVCLSIFPFSKEANIKIQESSIETAKLYVRQLARINSKAIIEQRISDVIPTLDERPGLTVGILKTYILDAPRSRIMAPSTEAGNSLPDSHALKATQQTSVWWEFDPSENVAYVSAPILVGTPEGDSVAATAYVIFDPTASSFSFAKILNNALISLLILLALSIVAVFVYQRFITVPIENLTNAIDRATASGTAIEKINIQWKEIQEIQEKVSVLISRVPSDNNTQTPEEWSANIARDLNFAAAAFDSTLKILEWNSSMEAITGVRKDYAVGADIGVASRDNAFETNVRELAAAAQNSPWSPQCTQLDFQGKNSSLTMIYGANHFLLLIKMEGEG